MNDPMPSSHPQEPPPASSASKTGKCPFASFVKGRPLLGSSLDFLHDTTSLLVNNYKLLGPIYRIRVLWLKFTVLLGAEARDFQRNGGERHLTRHPVFDPVGEQLGSADFALALSGEKHLQLRRLLQIAYSREVAGPFVPQFIEVVRQALKGWMQNGGDGESREVFESVQFLAFQQYCQVMGRTDLQEHYRDCRVVTDMNMEVGGRVLPLWMFHWPPYRAARKRVLKLAWDLVAAHRSKTSHPDPGPDIMDTLLSLQFPDGRSLTDDEVVCYSLYGFAGSSSYMGRLIAFMLYEILRDPALYKRLQSEVDAAFATGLSTPMDVLELRWLRAVYHETLRYHPVSQGMPFVAREDFEFHGKRVEKGQLVVLSQLPLLFSDPPFQNPTKFDPERCLEPRMEHRKPGTFQPFGMHHRTCAAMGLVELMALTMVATLLHECDLEMVPKDYRLRKVAKPLPAPDRRFHMRVRSRQAAVPQEPMIQQTLLPSEELCLAMFPGSESSEVQEALRQGKVLEVAAGEVLIRQGDPADAFYLILSGEVAVYRKNDAGSEGALARLRAGEYFGETGLLTQSPRNATVRAGSTAVRVLQLPAQAFHRIVADSDLISEEIARVLRRRLVNNQLTELCRQHPPEVLLRHLPGFQAQTRPAGTCLVLQGDPADAFYLLHTGAVRVTRVLAEHAAEALQTLKPGDYFGELGLLHNTPRTASCVAETEVVVLVCDAARFNDLVREAGGRNGDLAGALLQRLQPLGSVSNSSPLST